MHMAPSRFVILCRSHGVQAWGKKTKIGPQALDGSKDAQLLRDLALLAAPSLLAELRTPESPSRTTGPCP